MMRSILCAALAVSVAGVALVSQASHVQAKTFTAAQKEEMGEIIRAYLLENPEVIMESVAGLQMRQEQAAEAALQEQLVTKKDALFNDKVKPTVGNPKASVKVVEFVDYNCGYCKRAFAHVDEILNKDKDIQFILVEFPILSETSNLAARYALAANKQGKYYDLHSRLMKHTGPINEDVLAKIAKDLGLDVERLKKDANSTDVSKQIESNITLARDLGINGTPGFIINETPVRGYVDLDGMESIIASEREKVKK